MKPLNAKERTFGLLKFSGLFVLTLILVLFAVYFDFAIVPKTEVEGYKAKVNSLQATLETDNKLLKQLSDLNNNLIQYQNNPDNAIAASSVGNGITALTELAKADSISFTGKLSGQVSTLSGIAVGAINKVKESGANNSSLKALQDQLTQCQNDARDKDTKIMSLQSTLAIYQNSHH